MVYKCFDKKTSGNDINRIQNGLFWGYSQMGIGQKGPHPQNLPHISYNDET